MQTTKRRFCLPVSHAVNLYMYVCTYMYMHVYLYVCVRVCVPPANQLNNRNQFAPLHSPQLPFPKRISHPIFHFGRIVMVQVQLSFQAQSLHTYAEGEGMVRGSVGKCVIYQENPKKKT